MVTEQVTGFMSEQLWNTIGAAVLLLLGIATGFTLCWVVFRRQVIRKLNEAEAHFLKNLQLDEFKRGLEFAREAGDRVHRNERVRHLRVLQSRRMHEAVRYAGTTLERLHWACDEGCAIDHAAYPVAMICLCDILTGPATLGYECPVHPKDPLVRVEEGAQS